MGVSVYPRLGPLLRERNMSVSELCRQIRDRFGLSTDPKTLYRLASDDRIQRADLEVAGAAAALLDVQLSDLFDVRADPQPRENDGSGQVLDPRRSHRLAELFERQARDILTPTEQVELESLVIAYARRVREQALHEYAIQHGLTDEEANQASEADLANAVQWWQKLEQDPERRHGLIVGRKRRAGRSTT